MRLLKTICLAAALAATTALSFAQPAQDYPAKPIKIIVPFAAGGVVDALPRALAPELERRLGQPIIVESKPGAGSMVGAEFVAKSAPDGYTLLLATSSTLAVGPHLYKNLRFDMDRDLTPVTMIAISPSILMVRSDAPVDSFNELLALFKSRPGELSFASAGVGGVMHLHSELFMAETGTKLIHVPYQGASLAIADLQTGRVEMMIGTLGSNIGHVKGGKLKALAAMTDKRLPLLPDVPSVAELGYPQLAGDIWFALSAPAQTPPAIIERLQREVSAIVRSPAYREKFRPVGLDMVGGTSEEMAATVRRDGERWSRVIREANVKVD